MAKKIIKTKTVEFEEFEIQGVKYDQITVTAPRFKQVKEAVKNVKTTGFEADGITPKSMTLNEIDEVCERFVVLCGTSPNGPVIQEVVDSMDYSDVMELGTFCMGFMSRQM